MDGPKDTIIFYEKVMRRRGYSSPAEVSLSVHVMMSPSAGTEIVSRENPIYAKPGNVLTTDQPATFFTGS